MVGPNTQGIDCVGRGQMVRMELDRQPRRQMCPLLSGPLLKRPRRFADLPIRPPVCAGGVNPADDDAQRAFGIQRDVGAGAGRSLWQPLTENKHGPAIRAAAPCADRAPAGRAMRAENRRPAARERRC